MSYHHLSTLERIRIELFSKIGYSTRQIARQLNRHHSTIARELKRNGQQTYQAELADELAGQRRLVCYRKELKSEQLIQTIQKYLELTWLLEQISNTILKGVLSFKTIYRWIYDGTSIHQRPKEMKKSHTFGRGSPDIPRR